MSCSEDSYAQMFRERYWAEGPVLLIQRIRFLVLSMRVMNRTGQAMKGNMPTAFWAEARSLASGFRRLVASKHLPARRNCDSLHLRQVFAVQILAQEAATRNTLTSMIFCTLRFLCNRRLPSQALSSLPDSSRTRSKADSEKRHRRT